MKRLLITLSLVIVFGITCFAQRGDGRGQGKMRAQIEAQKISYITQTLDLTPEEAQVFWPVYNQLDKKKEVIRQRGKVLYRKLHHHMDSLSEKELVSISDELIDMKLEEAKLKKEYHLKFKKVLPTKKILNLYHTEKKFQGMLLKRIKDRGRHSQRNKN